MDDHLFELINQRMNKFEDKIDELMKWKWQTYGMSLVISLIGGIGINILIAYLSNRTV